MKRTENIKREFVLPFKYNKGVHCPGQVKDDLVSSDSINGLLGNYFRLKWWKELRKPRK